MIDFQAINSYLISSLRAIIKSWIPGGKFEGVQYVVRNPNRSDKTPGSFKINCNTGVWKDFSTGDTGGDPVSLYAYVENIKQIESANKLSEMYNIYSAPPITTVARNDTLTPVIPIPQNVQNRPVKFKNTKISEYYPYFGKNNELICYSCRVIHPDKKKDVVPLTYCSDGNGGEFWKFKSVPVPRPIYGLDDLEKYPNARVLIVEGEKCRDYAKKIFEKESYIVPIAWIGGSSGINVIDWSPIYGRKLILWPDADTQRDSDNNILPFAEQPGTKAMIGIYDKVKKHVPGARIIKPPEDKVNGWDIADSGFDKKHAVSFIKNNMMEIDQVKSEAVKKYQSNFPFQCLGYNSNNGTIQYYYLPVGTKKVTSLTAMGHSKMNMLSLAPMEFYESWKPSKNGPVWTAAINDCIRRCENIGLYDRLRVRGRGAWYDHGRSILHLGDRLSVDGKIEKTQDFESHYIYEAEIPTEMESDFMNAILEPQEAKKLVEICNMLSWENELSGTLLAGWLVLAPICGAVEWRPHIWITGESETGKSWIMDNIIYPMLGRSVIYAESNSSEAGIRQLLQSDAFPVIFDEIEMESRDDLKRVQNIINLARSASSNKNAYIVKGSASGNFVTYQIRSCFLFSSINPKLYQQADENRITLLKLVKRQDYVDGNKFDEVQDKVANTFTDEYCMKMRARSIVKIPVIRENAKILCRVMSKVLKSKRLGDQIGTLLAGACILKYNDVITQEKAEEIAKNFDSDVIKEVKGKTDQEKCLDIILESVIRSDVGNETDSIGTLLLKSIKEIKSDVDDDVNYKIQIAKETSIKALRKYGIAIISRNKEIAIAENHSVLKSVLFGTPWEGGYKVVLNRLPGVKKKTAIFGSGRRLAAISIPIDVVFPEIEIEGSEEW